MPTYTYEKASRSTFKHIVSKKQITASLAG